MKLTFATLFAAVCIMLNGAASAQSRQNFTLINATGYAIREVYVSPAGAEDWGSDILGKDILDDSDDVHIQFSKQEPGCMWDLLVTYDDDGSKVIWRNFNLCQISRITIRYNRRSDTTSASTE